jgi:pyruvate dehydrogenase E2 component (dihydrolipoyllysine-residue acetyltransferase)
MDVLMPQLGETVSEGKIVTWFKKIGDVVAPGDNLFEIETDKVSMEVPAIAGGTLSEIRVAQGEIAPVGTVVAVIADAAGASPQTQRAASGALPPSSPPPPAQAGVQKQADLGPRLQRTGGQAPAASHFAQPAMATRPIALDPFREVHTPERNFGAAKIAGGIAVTPLARRLAGENAIELLGLKGSGPHGRIVARDVETAIGPSAPAGVRAVAPSAASVMALYRDTPFEEVPLDPMRKTIAARLTLAKGTIPHFYLTTDVEIDKLLALRKEANAAAPAKDGEPAFRISLNDLVIKALALALQRVPAANAIWAEDRILRFKHSDIGVAVAIEGGLLTPVIRKAEIKSVSAISNEMRALAARARDKQLKPNEYQGGSTAISNLGMYGVREFSAIINPPHATILAVGAARRAPVGTEDGGIRFTNQMTVTLSCDHRVVDGVLGAQLLAALKGFLEQPVTMLV